ncbi:MULTISPECIES: sugar porter family MFS transporter [Corynebacterium]|uniref:sugar porter family MFS transporter n=1 Tax=Corynebacterium TaxID=1716 RepID=UPI0008A32FCA|nr:MULTISPECIES: sugar porter family MFS transporter [Corynebacterium]OFQ32232.1 MFS transporter [Corynebacterium sp. HMSC072D12]QQU96469.1 sugar porter family MFS transporter [Corynebacterium aurimucosum]UTA70648.1 sugar porter family MFS transporter [Corynebacterium aurimucosum]WJY71252.1 Major myo-inositol transporter IolT [Corynebacterium aurimucosum]
MNKDTYVMIVAGVAALGGLLFGYDTGVMSGALLFVGPEFGMSAHEEGLVTSMLLVGAAVGALAAGRVASVIGRRRTLIAGGLIFVAGSVWCALANSAAELATARTFLGVAVGAVSIVSPMYISEITPAAVRGRMVSLNTLMIVVGQLLAYGVNSLLAASGSWHWMLGLAAVPGGALALGMVLLPDTPAWLAAQGRTREAAAVSARVGARGAELEHSARPNTGEWRALRRHRWMRWAIALAMLMGLTQQITGVNAIVYFAPTMMNQVGISTTNSVYTSMVIGVVSVAACLVGLRVVDRLGRRRLLLAGLSGNVVSLVVLAVAYHFAYDSTPLAMLALTCMAAFIAFQQAAVSPATWLLMSEIVPPEVRGLGMGIAGLVLWVSNWAVAQFFLPVVEWLGGSLAFGIFAVLGLVAVGYTRALVPETAGKSLEDVAEQLRSRYSES